LSKKTHFFTKPHVLNAPAAGLPAAFCNAGEKSFMTYVREQKPRFLYLCCSTKPAFIVCDQATILSQINSTVASCRRKYRRTTKIGQRWDHAPLEWGRGRPIKTSPLPIGVTTSNLVVLRQRVRA